MRVKTPGLLEPLVDQFDWKIWTLLATTTTLLVGTPLINLNKRDKVSANLEKTNAAAALKDDETTIDENQEGIVCANSDITKAHFTEMLAGDELKNTNFVDVQKLQKNVLHDYCGYHLWRRSLSANHIGSVIGNSCCSSGAFRRFVDAHRN